MIQRPNIFQFPQSSTIHLLFSSLTTTVGSSLLICFTKSSQGWIWIEDESRQLIPWSEEHCSASRHGVKLNESLLDSSHPLSLLSSNNTLKKWVWWECPWTSFLIQYVWGGDKEMRWIMERGIEIEPRQNTGDRSSVHHQHKVRVEYSKILVLTSWEICGRNCLCSSMMIRRHISTFSSLSIWKQTTSDAMQRKHWVNQFRLGTDNYLD